MKPGTYILIGVGLAVAGLLGFLVGQTMKQMKGKADPGMVNQILTEILEG